MDYVIIGNGIIALSTAFRLTQKIENTDTITIIGPSSRPASATMAAAAMLNSFGEVQAHTLKSDESFFSFELSHMATHKWPEFEHELIAAAGDNLPEGCSNCEVFRGGCFDRGTYIINNTASDELDDKNFQAIVTALENFNEQYEFVEPEIIPNYYPYQDKRATRAIYIPNEGWLNPRLVLEKLDAILEHDPRVTVIDEKVKQLVKSDDLIDYADLEDGRKISGDVYLLANGASAEKTLSQSNLGLEIQGLFYGIGVSLEILSPDFPHQKCIRTPNRGGACGVYSTPYFLGPNESKEHILIGASNMLSPVPVKNGRLVSIEHLMKSAIEEINAHFYNAQLINTNVGWRPTTQDTYPLLGWTSISNLAIATGTKRDGFHMSPVISNMMADLLMGKEVDERLKWFAPEREIIRDISREDAIESAVNALMSEQYQHGYRPSNIRMNAQVRETYRKDIEDLHDRVGAKDWGIPQELMNMYRRGFAQWNQK